MSGTTTARKPRQPRQAKAGTAVTWVQMPETGSDALGVFAAQVAELRDAMAKIPPRISAYLDKDAMAAQHGVAATQEDAGKKATRQAHERGHAAVHTGRRLEGEAFARSVAPLELLPEEVAWRERDKCRTILVSGVQDATPFGVLDPDAKRHLANFNAAHDEDASGPAEPDPPAGPEEPDGDEHEPALDEAPMVINSNPAKPEPLRNVGNWKTGSKDGAKS